jgi:hypothetical protein
MRRWLGKAIGVQGRLETSIWIAAALAVIVLLVVSLVGGVSMHAHGVILAVPWILILILVAVRAYRHRRRRHVHNG